jgi:hypothetical protein
LHSTWMAQAAVALRATWRRHWRGRGRWLRGCGRGERQRWGEGKALTVIMEHANPWQKEYTKTSGRPKAIYSMAISTEIMFTRCTCSL